jgi:hypothetical protein
MPSDDIAIVKRAYEAFRTRDLVDLEAMASDALVVHNPVTGIAVGQERYEGRSALGRYLTDVDRVWERLEVRPQTFYSPRPGEVLVAGTVLIEYEGTARLVAAAWSWSLVGDLVVYLRVLPGVEADSIIALARRKLLDDAARPR